MQHIIEVFKLKKGVLQLKSNLEFFRKEAGLTRAELAELIDVDRTVIWKYERGICQPRDKTKVKIANALGCTVEEIFFSKGVV